MSDSVIVNEIYASLQGEGGRAGRACVIVRLTGCNLRCDWCDSTYAREEGTEMPISEVLEAVKEFGPNMVLVTGGEPLCQSSAPALLRRLCEAGHEVLLETNGSMDITMVDERVARCVDVKCPGSGQAGSFLESNFAALAAGDEVKFVLADRADYEYAREVIAARGLTERCEVILSPVTAQLAPAALAEWILADGLDVRLGLQLHKIIWPGRDRGV